MNGDETAIAIVGMACRFPGAANAEAFWQNIRDGVESIRTLSTDELQAQGIDDGRQHDPSWVKAAAVLDDMEMFDAAFFGFSPREAELMDPQHRVFLECAWAALEHAGYRPDVHRDPVGVFAGATTNTYLLLNLMSNRAALGFVDPVQIDVGNGADFLATRVSYRLNLTGPACTVQTACSTSLVAVHMACQSLLNGECDLALAGGASVNVMHPGGYQYVEGGIVSPDGHCRPFDARANGTIFGSGAGVVVLKRLGDARADGDTIYAVVRGSAINNDGSGKVGYTAPSVAGQAAVITEALANAGVTADTIGYVEAHGTGTNMGDPIEVRALTRVFRQAGAASQRCPIGSVKGNIGHLAGAAGIASLIKAVQALHHRCLPPSLHVTDPNPEIDFASTPFYVITERADWQRGMTPRRAGVSSFGVGGTNAHVVLEEAPSLPSVAAPQRPHLLVLSAKTEGALERGTDALAAHLAHHTSQDLGAVAYTLQTGRSSFTHRRYVVASNHTDAAAALGARDVERSGTGHDPRDEPPVVFLFPGQGAQYATMGRGLYDSEPVYRDAVDHCAAILHPLLGFDIRTMLFPAPGNQAEANQHLSRTALTQPAMFVTSYALTQLWRSWGVEPAAMIGHSVGEYVAASIAGVLSLDDALRLVAERGRLIQSLPEGAMVAAMLPIAEAQAYATSDLAVAATNGPRITVLSGPPAEIDALCARLDGDHVPYRRLHTSHAFHSALLDPILAPWEAVIRTTTLHVPTLPYISNVTGTWIEARDAVDPDYWVRHLRQTVRFGEGITTLLGADPSYIFLEVGPGQGLTKLVQAHFATPGQYIAMASMRHPQEIADDLTVALEALGKLWLHGIQPRWEALHAQARRVGLPTYAFERTPYWIDAVPADAIAPPATRAAEIANWFHVPTWTTSTTPTPQQNDNQGVWVCFVDDSIGDKIAARLCDHHDTVIVVRMGDTFMHHTPHVYTIDPRQRAHMSALFDALTSMPVGILYGWTLAAEHATVGDAPLVASLVHLLAELDERCGEHTTRLVVLSDGLLAVVDGEPVMPVKAAVYGMCESAAVRNPHLRITAIDITAPSSGIRRTRLVDQVVADMHAATDGAPIAYRGNQRWIAGTAPTPLHSRPARALRPNGVYLIAGPLTAVGRALAATLVERTSARVVVLDADAHDAVSLDTIVASADASAGQVYTIKADAHAPAELDAVLGWIHAAWDQLDGLVYAALATTTRDTPDAYDEQIQRTVQTLARLAQASEEHSPDFCLVHAILPTVHGDMACAAAARIADAFVRHQNDHAATHWIGVTWSAMPCAAGGDSADLFSISTAEAARALYRAITSTTTDHLIVAPSGLAALEPRSAAMTSDAALALHNRPDDGTPVVPPRTPLEQQVGDVWQRVLGIHNIGIHDSFFDLGGHSLLATQLLTHIQRTFAVELPLRSLFEHPTIAGVTALLEAHQQASDEQAVQPLVQQITWAFPSDRPRILEWYLARIVAPDVGDEPHAMALPDDGAITATEVIRHVKRDLQLQLYPHEVLARPVVGELAHFIMREYDRLLHLRSWATTTPASAYSPRTYRMTATDRPPRPIETPNPRMVFLHSSPRAGSTLLRIMLAGHPGLFCPPELNLLFFEDMAEWQDNLGFGHSLQWTAQGLHWALVELMGLDSEQGWKQIDEMVAANLSVQGVYGHLQSLAGDRLLVDKTPNYALDPATLARAEAYFDAPAYIFLVRHPYAVIESLLNARFDRLFQSALFEDATVDPYVVAETVWAQTNRNLLAFFEQVGPERVHIVHYEDLVSQPAPTMRTLCDFLAIPFDEQVLAPYDGHRRRMISGLGDPNILQHSDIDAQLGEAWKHVRLPRRLDVETRHIAHRLGYALPEDEAQPVQTPPIGPTAPLSFAQQRIWFIEQLMPGTRTYIMPIAARLSGTLDAGALHAAVATCVARHEVLRTSVHSIAGQLFQIVASHVEIPMSVVELQHLDPDAQTTAVQEHIATEARRTFSLDSTLLRTLLLRLHDDEHILLITIHHIISDGWSVGVLIDEIATSYRAAVAGTTAALPPLPLQYADYARWQRHMVENGGVADDLAYWKAQLADPPPPLELPADHARTVMPQQRGAQYDMFMPPSLLRAAQEASRNANGTLFMTLLAAFDILLHRQSGQHDITVGSPIAGRLHPDLHHSIGCFINTLVFRTNLADDPTIETLLRRVQQTTHDALDHQRLPFERLVDELQPPRQLGQTPFFQVMFVLQNTPMPAVELPHLWLESIMVEREASEFELTLAMRETPDGLHARFEYDANLFERATMERFAAQYQLVLEAIAANPRQRVSEIALLHEDERQRLLVEWNPAPAPLPDVLVPHRLVEHHAAHTPAALAVVCGDDRLAYGELNARANAIAHRLRALGVGPDARVGICMERSAAMPVALLGIMKAGGAYVALDPVYPTERLAAVVEDAQLAALVTHSSLLDRLPPHPATLCLDHHADAIAREATTNPDVDVHPDNLAYIIYTSGSTGKPNGVQISHHAVAHHCQVIEREYGITSSDRVLQFSSITFDASVEQWLMPLTVGATVYMRDDAPWSAQHLHDHLARWQVTVMDLPTAFWQHWVQAYNSAPHWATLDRLRLVVLGGEALQPQHVERWRQTPLRCVRLLNAYGPTETTVSSTYYDVPQEGAAEQHIPIGRPLSNCQLYILDRHFHPVPVGVYGDLYIGGDSLARGYLGRPDLTAERFVPHPWSATPGARLYRTGDRARFRVDGMIEFGGRNDHQVKIRGFRVELGEVEGALRRVPNVRDAVVLTHADQHGDLSLVAYVVSAPNTPLTVTELRRELAERVPDYMIPTQFMFLDMIPLTPSSKVDTRALPSPSGVRPALEASLVMPQTTTQKTIALIWQDVLDISSVGINDNFFELGGNSLRLVEIHSKIQQQVDENISLVDLFQYPTIGALAAHLGQSAGITPVIEQVQQRAERQKASIERQKQIMRQRRR